MIASNENRASASIEVPPYIHLRHTGDHRVFARVLAQIIVRQQLNFAGLIGDGPRCDDERAAG